MIKIKRYIKQLLCRHWWDRDALPYKEEDLKYGFIKEYYYMNCRKCGDRDTYVYNPFDDLN